MEEYTCFYIIALVLLLSCTTSTEEEVPDYVHNLKQKPQVPDSLGLKLQLDIHQVTPNEIEVGYMLINNGSHDFGFEHSSSFVRVAVYEDTSLLYPDPKYADSYIYPDDLINSEISVNDTLRIGNKLLDISKASTPKIMGYAKITISIIGPQNIQREETVWLLSEPKLFQRSL